MEQLVLSSHPHPGPLSIVVRQIDRNARTRDSTLGFVSDGLFFRSGEIHGTGHHRSVSETEKSSSAMLTEPWGDCGPSKDDDELPAELVRYGIRRNGKSTLPVATLLLNTINPIRSVHTTTH